MSRLWLALLLGGGLALPARAQAPEASVSLSSGPVRAQLESLGYRYDETSRRYVDAKGKGLSAKRLRQYLSPYDYRRGRFSRDDRLDLLFEGFRLEPATGHILSPGEHKPATVLEIESRKAQSSQDRRRDSLERLAVLVDAQDPSQPLPAPARFQAMTLMKDSRLPANLGRDIKSLKTLAGAVASDVDQAYLDTTRAYDGKLTPAELTLRIEPLAPPTGAPPATAYFDGSERALGEVLQQATSDYMTRNPVGAELLSHFRDATGTLQLPAIVVIPMGFLDAAGYDKGVLAINQGNVVGSILAQAPAAERAALEKQLADSRELARYLSAHPQAIDGFFRDNDAIIAHELTHAWQHRRDPFWEESERGNFPDADYIEQEHEAYLTEMRFIHEKLKSDPSALARNYDLLDDYRRFVTDLDGWRDEITQTYLETLPQDAATLSTGEELQEERVKAARALESQGAFWQTIEPLKLLALGVGSKQEQAYHASYSKLFEDFRGADYPKIQKESSGLLAKTFLIKAQTPHDDIERRYDLSDALAYAKIAGDADLIAQVQALQKQ